MNITGLQCSDCGREFGSMAWTYVLDAEGQRVTCLHPGEYHTIERVTGLDEDEARRRGLVGYESHCTCLACARQFNLDERRDARVCPGCKSSDVRPGHKLAGATCPACRRGTLVSQHFGVA